MVAFKFSVQYAYFLTAQLSIIKIEQRPTLIISNLDKLNLTGSLILAFNKCIATAQAVSKILLTSKVVKTEP